MGCRFRSVQVVGADCEDDCVALLYRVVVVCQLDELSTAELSPECAVEDEDDVAVSPIRAQRIVFPARTRQREVGGKVADVRSDGRFGRGYRSRGGRGRRNGSCRWGNGCRCGLSRGLRSCCCRRLCWGAGGRVRGLFCGLRYDGARRLRWSCRRSMCWVYYRFGCRGWRGGRDYGRRWRRRSVHLCYDRSRSRHCCRS